MQKKFLSNLILLLAVNLIIKPLTIFGIDTEVQNRMGTAEFGLYFTLFNFTTIFNILIDLGINNFTVRNVALHPHVLKKYMGSTLLLRLILSFVYLIFCSIVGLAIGYQWEMLPLIILFGVQQITYTIISYSRSYLSGLLLFKQDAFLSVLDKTLVLIVCGTLLYAGINFDFTVQNYISIQLICNGIAAVIALVMLLRQVGNVQFKFRKALFIYIIRESLPYALFIVLMMLYTRMDSVMIERLHVNGQYESGVYAQGFRLVDAGFMFAMLFGTLLLPLFSKLLKDKGESKRLLKVASKLLIWGAIAISFIACFNAEMILHTLYDEVAANGVLLVQVQFITFVWMCGTVIYGTYLTAVGDMRLLNQIGLVGLIVNLLLNIGLIPQYGALGAAIATAFTQAAVTTIQFWKVKSHLKVSISFMNVAILLIYIGVLFILGCMISGQPFGLLLYAGICFALLFVFKVIDVKGFIALIKLER